jgi:hypothetical protein
MSNHGQQSTTSRCQHCGRGHGGQERGLVSSGVALEAAAGGIAGRHGKCFLTSVSRGGFAKNEVGEVGG